MTRFSLRSLAQHKLRTILTALAILLGVAMISGTYVLTDQIDAGFADIYKTALGGVDVVVTPKPAFGGSAEGMDQTLPASLVDRIANIDGVGKVAGGVQTLGVVLVNGTVLQTGGAPTLVNSVTPDPFTTVTWAAGTRPRNGQVAIDRTSARKHHLELGDVIGLGTSHGVKQVAITGTFDFGSPGSSLGGTILIAATLHDVQQWYDHTGRLSYIDVDGASGVAPAELAARIKAALPAGVAVKTGAQSAADQTEATSKAIGGVLTPALLAFGGVAVLVGAFIIFNTFSITVAQRRREFAMLRTLGASRRQVLTGVIGEALTLGVVASLAGLGAGLSVARGINRLFQAVGADIPIGGLALHARTVVVALAVGIVVTLLAALIPALRATRVPPVAALQEGASLPPSRITRLTPVFGAVLALGGAAALLAGMFGSGATTNRLFEMACGAVLIFMAVATVARYIVRPAARVLGWPIERIAGASGRLARENAARNPGRTASTAAALMVSLAVIVFVAVFAQGLKSSFVDAVDRQVQASFVVAAQQGQPIPMRAVEAISRTSGVAHTAAITEQTVQLNGASTIGMFAVDPAAIAEVWRFHWLKGGSDRLLSALRGQSVVVEEQFAGAHRLSVGGTFRILTRDGERASFTVIGIYRDANLATGFVVSQATYDRLYPATQRDPFWILAKTAPGASQTQVQADLKKALKAFPTAQVQTKAEYSDQVKKNVNQLLMMLYSLLAVSVLISIFGIVNTLVLSVYERTREIGMLRAIGSSRRQIRRMVRYESVITAIMGGLLGIVVGVVFAYLITTRLVAQGISFAVPGAQLAAFLAVAVAVGVLAAVLPARRAARVNVLEAIHYE